MGRTQPVKTVVLLFLKKSFVKSVDVFPSLHMWTCILNFFCTWSLFFFLFLCLSSRRICHCLAKTAGECYLRSFLPPSFSPPPSVFSWLSWERPAPSMTKNSRTERCCRPWFCTLCLESSEEAWVVLVVLSVQPLSERGGEEVVQEGCCRCLIKASRELWMLSMVLKAILPFPVAQSLAPYLPFSFPSARL